MKKLFAPLLGITLGMLSGLVVLQLIFNYINK